MTGEEMFSPEEQNLIRQAAEIRGEIATVFIHDAVMVMTLVELARDGERNLQAAEIFAVTDPKEPA